MGARDRQRNLGDAVYEERKWYGVVSTTPRYPVHQRTIDSTGPKPWTPNRFDSTKIERSGMLMRKNWSDGDYLRGATLPYSDDQCVPWEAFNPHDYANRLLASGPLTPAINLPLFIYELKDLPDMLKHAGDLLHNIRDQHLGGRRLNPINAAASSTLAYQFGWGPLWEDLNKLLTFSDIVSKRHRVLAGAHSEKGIRRRITLLEDEREIAGSQYMAAAGSYVYSTTYNGSRSVKAWGTVRWRVRDPELYGVSPSYTDAFRSAMGLNPGMIPITLWKALPWSWFADWFLDISNVMLANYNTTYYTPINPCVMWTTTEERQYLPIFEGEEEICSNGIWKGTVKARTPVSPTARVTLKLPYLDSFKTSILGSMVLLGTLGSRKTLT